MNNISMIACVGENLELGKNNDLIWHLPNDLKYFKKTTLGKTVVMGRRTFESLPFVLPKRRNIILQSSDRIIPGAEIFHDIESVLESVKDEDEVFIIGGATLYKQFLEYASKLYLTEVKMSCPDATVYFPKFNKELYNKRIIDSNVDNGIEYDFAVYEKKLILKK